VHAFLLLLSYICYMLIAFSRPSECPEMMRGRTLKRVLECIGLPNDFMEWRVIVEDRSLWLPRAYSRPVRPEN